LAEKVDEADVLNVALFGGCTGQEILKIKMKEALHYRRVLLRLFAYFVQNWTGCLAPGRDPINTRLKNSRFFDDNLYVRFIRHSPEK
jgi:hypothetical protein